MSIIGIGCIALAVFLFVRVNDFRMNGIKTRAVITEIDERYDGEDYDHEVYVAFEVNGVKYEGILDTYVSGFYEGKEIEIVYMRDDPKNFIYAKNPSFAAYIVIIIGVTLIFCGTYNKISEIVRHINTCRYKKNGREVRAVVGDVRRDGNSNLLGNRKLLVSCFDENGKLYEKTIFYDPDLIKKGDGATIYIDDRDPDKFIMRFNEKTQK